MSLDLDAATDRPRAARCLRWLAAQGVRRPSAATLRKMASAMREAGLGPASVNRHLSALRPVLRAAGLEPDMPWQREPRGRSRVLTEAEVGLLEAALLPRQDVSSLVRFLWETGMRLGEALGLSWGDVEGPWATLRRTKNGDTRRVPLSPAALAALGRRRGQAVGPWHGTSESSASHAFRRAREGMDWSRGDREVVMHSLRHGFASRLVNAQVSLPVIGAILGHRDFRSTLRYAHPTQEGMADAVRRLA